MRQRHLSFFLTITFISGLFFYSGDVSALKEETPVLKNIYVKDEEKNIQILIEGSSSLTYNILKTSDPLRIIVELPGAEAGTVKRKITIGKDPVLDISTEEQDKPFKMVRIEIGLSTSVDVIPSYQDNRLVIDIPKKSAEIPLEITKEEFQKLMETAKTRKEDKLILVIEPSQPPSEASVEVAKEEPQKPADPPQPPSEAPVEVAKEEPQKPVKVQKEIEKESLSVTAKEEKKKNATVVTGVKVDKEKGLSVIISGDGEMRYETFRLKDDRLVIDIPDTVNKSKQIIYKVGDPPLNSVRIGQHMKPKKKVRVVLDLEKPFSYEINKMDNQLIINLKTPPLTETKADPPQPPSVAPVEVAKEEPQKPVEATKEIKKESLSVTAKEEQKRNATVVTGVKVDKEKGLSVIISGDGEMRYETFMLKDDRLVIDILDTVNKSKQIIYKVGDPPLNSVRIGQHMKPKKKVRVVLDLEKPFSYEINKMDNQLIINLKTPPLTETKADPPQPPSVAPVEVAKEEPQKPVEAPQPPAETPPVAPVEVSKEEPQKPVEVPQPPAETPPVAPVEAAKEEPQKPVEAPQPPAETPPVALVEVAKEEDPKKLKEPPKPPSVAPVEAAKEEPQKPVEVPKEIEKKSPSVTAKEEQKEKATAVTGVKVDNQLIVNLKTPPSPELPKEKDKKEKKEIIAKKAEDSSEMVEKKVSPSEKEKILKKEITSQDTTLSTQKVDEPVPSIKKDTPLTEKTQTPKSPEVPVSGKYTGKKVSFDFRDIDIISLLYLFESVSGMNFIVSPEVKGKVTVKMREVPWDQALNIILKTHHLGKVVEDNIIRVVPIPVLVKERGEIAKAKEEETKAEDLLSRIIALGYSKPGPMKEAIDKAKVLSSRGNVSVDERTNTLILKDIPKNLAEAEALIKVLDKPTPQVSIEAKIVEASTNFTRELGIQWGFKNVQSAAYGNPLPYTFPHSMTVGGSTLTGGTGMSGNSWAVNLPAAVQEGSGGALGIALGNITNSFTLDLQISALESTGQAKILSNPKIVTLDNEKAMIKQGRKIPYATTSAEGTKTEFVDAVLSLTVTPTITPGGAISMKIEITKDEKGDDTSAGPIIEKKEANTNVLVRDGETIVIGGILTTTKRDSTSGLPLLHKIPILGWLFKKEKDSEDTTELLIFITPRIVKPY